MHSEYEQAEDDFEDYDLDFEFSFKKSSPTILFNYGLTKLSRKDFSSKDFVNPISFELKLGTTRQKNIYDKDDLIKETLNYFAISNHTSYLRGKGSNTFSINNDTWEFGFGNQKGYGYKISSSFSIIPYTENSFNWSRVNFAYDTNSVDINDRKIIELYDESFRYGNSIAGGIKFQILNNFAFDLSYERQVIFQRLLFWKLAGSTLIEFASQGLLDNFIERIFKSSPYTAPIVSFVLKNALSYGIYELRREKMNWPFNSEPSLFFDQFKVGVSFIF
jgi:hypothetical protein